MKVDDLHEAFVVQWIIPAGEECTVILHQSSEIGGNQPVEWTDNVGAAEVFSEETANDLVQYLKQEYVSQDADCSFRAERVAPRIDGRTVVDQDALDRDYDEEYRHGWHEGRVDGIRGALKTLRHEGSVHALSPCLMKVARHIEEMLGKEIQGNGGVKTSDKT
jgi:hypothetical protein